MLQNFSIKWKLSLSFIILSLGLLSVYIIMAKQTSDSDKTVSINEGEKEAVTHQPPDPKNEVSVWNMVESLENKEKVLIEEKGAVVIEPVQKTRAKKLQVDQQNGKIRNMAKVSDSLVREPANQSEEPISGSMSDSYHSFAFDFGWGYSQYAVESRSNQSQTNLISDSELSFEGQWTHHLNLQFKTHILLGISKVSVKQTSNNSLDTTKKNLNHITFGLSSIHDFFESAIFVSQQQEIFIRAPQVGQATMDDLGITSFELHTKFKAFEKSKWTTYLNASLGHSLDIKTSQYQIQSSGRSSVGVSISQKLDSRRRIQYSLQYKTQQIKSSLISGEYKSAEARLGFEFDMGRGP